MRPDNTNIGFQYLAVALDGDATLFEPIKATKRIRFMSLAASVHINIFELYMVHITAE